MRRGVLLAVLAALAFPASEGAAHDVDVTSVARVFLEQVGERRYTVSIVDSQVPPIANVESVLPSSCTPSAATRVPGVRGFGFECERELTFDDVLTLPWALAGVVVLASWRDGTEASAYFRGDGKEVAIRLADLRAGAGTVGRLAGRYVGLGVEHILSGLDHLLFVLGLLMLVGGLWPLVKTITAFTLAHSITLAAAVLGFIPVESGPVEAAIALSIVLLAREIVTGYQGQEHLVHRRPWLVAFAFGLLHGLGFAGALSEIGLPGGDIPLALLFFNVGVEAGQLMFVAALLALGAVFHRVVDVRPRRIQPVVGYALGTLSMLWLVDRLPAVWGA